MKLMVRLILLVSIFSAIIDAYAQDFSTGARTRALGNTCIADTNAWSLFINPAGMAHVKNTSAFISNEYLYGLNEVHNFSAGMLMPIKQKVRIGIHVNKLGYQWFNDQQIGIHAGHAIGVYNLGISVILWQRIAGDTYRETHPIVNIGGTMSINKSVQVGLHINNISNTQNKNQTLPIRIQVGTLYKISSEVLLYSDLEKQSSSGINLRTGIEYKIHTHFYLRSGLQFNPMRFTAGVGFNNKHLSIDYSLAWQYPLGSRHQLSILVPFLKKS
jgi:hypothetical protein